MHQKRQNTQASTKQLEKRATASTTIPITRNQSNSLKGLPRPKSGFNGLDVLSGRGGLANTHTGNRVYRRLVHLNKETYLKLATKRDKGLLVDSIIFSIQKHGGRFLKQNPETGAWDHELTYKEAVLKTGQALREHDKRRIVTSGFQHNRSDHSSSHQRRTKSEIAFSKVSDEDSVIKSLPLDTVDEIHSQREKQAMLDPIPVVPPPPMLHMWPSALNPATSKIAGPIYAQIAEDDRDDQLFNHQRKDTVNEELCLFPPYSFDDVMERQESLGISGALKVPNLSRESSMAFAISNLIDDEASDN